MSRTGDWILDKLESGETLLEEESDCSYHHYLEELKKEELAKESDQKSTESKLEDHPRRVEPQSF